MAKINLPIPTEGQNIEETVQNIMDVMVKYRKELHYGLSVLDYRNIDEIDGNRIRVKNLYVGENVFMAPDALISWENIDKPIDLTYAADLATQLSQYVQNNDLAVALASYITGIDLTLALSSYTTTASLNSTLSNYASNYTVNSRLTDLLASGNSNLRTVLGQNYIVTGSIAANQIATGQLDATRINTAGLGAEKVYNPLSPNSALCIGGTSSDLILSYSGAEFFKLYNGLSLAEMSFFGNKMLSYDNYAGDGWTGVKAHGKWDFSSTTEVKGAVRGVSNTYGDVNFKSSDVGNVWFENDYDVGFDNGGTIWFDNAEDISFANDGAVAFASGDVVGLEDYGYVYASDSYGNKSNSNSLGIRRNGSNIAFYSNGTYIGYVALS